MYTNFFFSKLYSLLLQSAIVRFAFQGTTALKDYKIQNKSGSDGPMQEARKLIMLQYHRAFHGPARIWLAYKKVQKQREYRKWYKETVTVGRLEFNKTKIRRAMWLLRCSMQLAQQSGPSRIGGYNGGQGSGSGTSIAEIIFRKAASSTSKGTNSFVMKMKQWKKIIEPLRSKYFVIDSITKTTTTTTPKKSKKPKKPKKTIRLMKLPSNDYKAYVIQLEMIFSSSKSRGDGLTFDDFIIALSKIFVLFNTEAKRKGGYSNLLVLRRVNHIWGELIQPISITSWKSVLDTDTHQYYWYNEATKESVWTPPKGVLKYNQLLKEKEEEDQNMKNKKNKKNKKKKIHPEKILDRASTVLSLILSSSGSFSMTSASMHKEIRRMLHKCITKDMHTIIIRLQRKWNGRPNLLQILLDAAYRNKYQAWLESERTWAALTIQCAVRRLWGKRIAWKLICKKIYKFQTIETGELPPMYHKDAPPTLTSKISYFWFKKGNHQGVGQSKHWTIPPLLARYLGDVPIIPVDHDTVNPLCQFCDEDKLWNGHENHEEVSKEWQNNDQDNDMRLTSNDVPWWEHAEKKQQKHPRRTVTKRCNDCSEMYCNVCYHRCHRKGKQLQHQYTPMSPCERCGYLVATVQCYGCAAHPLWQEMFDLGHPNSTGRKFWHNAHIGTDANGTNVWEQPFGFGGSAKYCEGCFHVAHPNDKYRLQSVDQKNSDDDFLKKIKIKKQKWKNECEGTVTKHATRAVHRYKPLTRRCDECGDTDERPAIWSCNDCGFFCTSCLNLTHSTGNRQYHVIEQACELLHGNDYNKKKLEEKERARKLEEERTRLLKEAMYKIDLLKATRIIQKCWKNIKRKRKQEKERKQKVLKSRQKYKQQRRDDIERQQALYRIKRGMGLERHLKSDDLHEIARKNMQPFMVNGLHNKLIAQTSQIKRKILKEFRLPGLVKMKKGIKIAYTTNDLTDLLERGDTIRIGPTSIYTIQGGINETDINEDNANSNATPVEPEKPKELLQPFNKFVIPLSDYWFSQDATMYIYYIQNITEMLACPPETAKDVINDRKQRAWLLANPPPPDLEAIEAKRLREEEKFERENRGYNEEGNKEKEKRLKDEMAAMKAKMNKLKNRRKLSQGGKKGRAQKMKAVKKAKAAKLKAEKEEQERIENYNNSTGMEDAEENKDDEE